MEQRKIDACMDTLETACSIRGFVADGLLKADCITAVRNTDGTVDAVLDAIACAVRLAEKRKY